MGDLDGKVAIVTGAGRGLGRVEAIALAKQGARLVINDLGTTSEGSGADEEPARQVVEEIKAFGGEAIVAFGDVASWDDTAAMIKKTIDTFGDLNIVVNNAGFLRDGMIFSMTEEEFDSVVRVHLKGHFCSMRMATEYWRKKAKAGENVYGRLVSTSSEAFLFGSVGQPNYAAAKAGITAMTMAAAQAMIRYGVTANVICPRARTRMNDSGPYAALFAKPESGFDVFDSGKPRTIRRLSRLATSPAHFRRGVRGLGQAGHRRRPPYPRYPLRKRCRRPLDRRFLAPAIGAALRTA